MLTHRSSFDIGLFEWRNITAYSPGEATQCHNSNTLLLVVTVFSHYVCRDHYVSDILVIVC